MLEYEEVVVTVRGPAWLGDVSVLRAAQGGEPAPPPLHAYTARAVDSIRVWVVPLRVLRLLGQISPGVLGELLGHLHGRVSEMRRGELERIAALREGIRAHREEWSAREQSSGTPLPAVQHAGSNGDGVHEPQESSSCTRFDGSEGNAHVAMAAASWHAAGSRRRSSAAAADVEPHDVP